MKANPKSEYSHNWSRPAAIRKDGNSYVLGLPMSLAQILRRRKYSFTARFDSLGRCRLILTPTHPRRAA